MPAKLKRRSKKSKLRGGTENPPPPPPEDVDGTGPPLPRGNEKVSGTGNEKVDENEDENEKVDGNEDEDVTGTVDGDVTVTGAQDEKYQVNPQYQTNYKLVTLDELQKYINKIRPNYRIYPAIFYVYEKIDLSEIQMKGDKSESTEKVIESKENKDNVFYTRVEVNIRRQCKDASHNFYTTDTYYNKELAKVYKAALSEELQNNTDLDTIIENFKKADLTKLKKIYSVNSITETRNIHNGFNQNNEPFTEEEKNLLKYKLISNRDLMRPPTKPPGESDKDFKKRFETYEHLLYSEFFSGSGYSVLKNSLDISKTDEKYYSPTYSQFVKKLNESIIRSEVEMIEDRAYGVYGTPGSKYGPPESNKTELNPKSRFEFAKEMDYDTRIKKAKEIVENAKNTGEDIIGLFEQKVIKKKIYVRLGEKGEIVTYDVRSGKYEHDATPEQQFNSLSYEEIEMESPPKEDTKPTSNSILGSIIKSASSFKLGSESESESAQGSAQGSMIQSASSLKLEPASVSESSKGSSLKLASASVSESESESSKGSSLKLAPAPAPAPASTTTKAPASTTSKTPVSVSAPASGSGCQIS
jgi:hypothetical protein